MPVIIGRGYVQLNDVKAALNITADTYDDRLQSVIDAASQMVVNRIGPISSVSVDEWHDGGTEQIWLRQSGPILAVSSVTESLGSVVYTLTEVDMTEGASGEFTYSVDLNRAVLVRRVAGIATPFAAGVQNIHITYLPGYNLIPADIQRATLLLIQHLWETQRGSSGRPNQGSPGPAGAAGQFPAGVMEILAPYIVPGIA